MEDILKKIRALYLTNWNDTTRQQAFEWLWQNYYQPLTYFLRPMTGADTADLVQDIMLKIYQALPQLNPFLSLSSWIYTIARNHALNHLDKKRKRPHHIEFMEEQQISGETGPLDKVMHTDMQNKLNHLLSNLPPEQAQMAFLFFYQGLKYREIARIMDKPVGSVKSRIFLIRKTLTRELEEYIDES